MKPCGSVHFSGTNFSNEFSRKIQSRTLNYHPYRNRDILTNSSMHFSALKTRFDRLFSIKNRRDEKLRKMINNSNNMAARVGGSWDIRRWPIRAQSCALSITSSMANNLNPRLCYWFYCFIQIIRVLSVFLHGLGTVLNYLRLVSGFKAWRRVLYFKFIAHAGCIIYW